MKISRQYNRPELIVKIVNINDVFMVSGDPSGQDLEWEE